MRKRIDKAKYKKYFIKKTILAFGEGSTEKAFLKYLKQIYYRGRQSRFSVKIECGYGGGPNKIIEDAIKIKLFTAYDYAFCLLDTDEIWPVSSKTKAKKYKLELIGNNPCIEGFFLDILGVKYKNKKECKRIFRERYLSDDDKVEEKNYKKIFPVELIEKRRKKVKALNKIINILMNRT